MADLTGGQLVARTLWQAGVGHLFTLCGGHILPIYDGCLTEGVRVIDCRHEQAAAHAGDAYARLTRGIGVAVVVPGPGVTDAGTGVANADAARSPLLLIRGGPPLRPRRLRAPPGTEPVAPPQPPTNGPRARGRWPRRGRSPRCWPRRFAPRLRDGRDRFSSRFRSIS